MQSPAPCCQRAELSALVRMNGSIQFKEKRLLLDVITENPATARHIFSLMKELYGVQPEVYLRRKVRLKKNNVYVIRVAKDVESILHHLGIVKSGGLARVTGIQSTVIKKACCKKSYLRGAFLSGGSVNHPESASYHMEIVSTYHDHGTSLCKLMNHFHLHARMIERKKGFVVYIKEGDKIGEFLNIIGAHPSLLRFEDSRILKDMRNSVNRLVNCETANLNRTIQAAMKQVENIELIQERLGLSHLPKSLREVAEIRLQYPEMNLAELGQLIPSQKISKSAINHRLRKIEEIANQLRKADG